MTVDDDAALAGVLHGIHTGVLEWLDWYLADQVDPAAVAAFRHAVGEPDPASVTAMAGVVVDLAWWLDTCDEDEVDSHVVVKVLESVVSDLDELPAAHRRRLLDVLEDLAAAEPHEGRRYELRLFPFATGLTEEEFDDDPPGPRAWVPPAAR
ncbi:hypothetical protein [Virgisporangium aurantiacum]|uniref:Uncharacterized protein n=1 Tax=Virgisporangium aurantiacum TaxID=175570 RepID=A0A8J4E063_9ACTN|nr:hypothetical protein [Virgisporangium aurantiacum]GIJ56456.1 hypothetical protein Vau01_039720 [Virgisporangium aurantiacum]